MTAFQVILVFAAYLAFAVLVSWAGARLSLWLHWREGRERRAAAVARWEAAHRESERKWQLVGEQMRADAERIRRELTGKAP
jgi:hypothetical protein